MQIDSRGFINTALQRACRFYNERPDENDISLLVIHNISLPAAQFGTQYIDDLFMGCIDSQAHPSFADLKGVEVSAHCVIKRTGELIQYVPFNKRAWHAGVSQYKGRNGCNDFSIGIELEGCDDVPYTAKQYTTLITLTQAILKQYPKINTDHIVGHCDIAPGRKTDPGISFDWTYFFNHLKIQAGEK
ncbi:1,6-anhydro-N-acetylmuramyl-L-alanine amidase AmpD [Pseudoalteromonas sp. MMG010]|uniref:1,6-anhydro-N-acetylmuramyl-L-alanine amidase AmpD n=1 Tax=Pseudoalteromonas sp. MMG010 TaxID=2822685 RepID=UPI001B3A488E|nr:1,6-anhydro-N-acetylmuramyl-L-alanine amidase AmpD [Pseudoalteromonas sp. MMG010]MBQ4832759.1 1,6-anhydro-N-acetylmuramyl-L-alanine amidase AmpD [Pseudoalteromonas sp. MMG010]